MKIGIDIQATNGRATGLGIYTRHLMAALMEQPTEFKYFLYKKEGEKELDTLERWRWENIQLPKLAARDKVQLLHIPAFAPPFLSSVKVVVTVHDIIGMIFPNQLRWPSRFYWGKWLPHAIKRAHFIIADSESTKSDIMRFLKIPESRIRVVYPSGHESFTSKLNPKLLSQLKARLGIRGKYFLFVGTIEPRKNLKRVIEAFMRFLKYPKDDASYQLVVVGQKGFGHGKMYHSIASTSSAAMDDVIYAGYRPHGELNQLYCGAEALVYPSLYEGFGIPILEAMASGTPVLTAKRTSIPEVAGDAVLYIDAYQSESIAEGMLRITQDSGLREKLVAAGFEQIKKFSWKKTASQTVEIYRMFTK